MMHTIAPAYSYYFSVCVPRLMSASPNRRHQRCRNERAHQGPGREVYTKERPTDFLLAQVSCCCAACWRLIAVRKAALPLVCCHPPPPPSKLRTARDGRVGGKGNKQVTQRQTLERRSTTTAFSVASARCPPALSVVVYYCCCCCCAS